MAPRPSRQGQEHDSEAALAELVGGLAGLLTMLAVAIPVAVGIGLGELLRRRRLRWTWGVLIALVALAVPAALGFGDEANGVWHVLKHHVRHYQSHEVLGWAWRTWRSFAWVVLPFWLPLVGLGAAGWKLWRDRRDNLRGGQVRTRVELARGPIQLGARALARWQAERVPVRP